MLPKKSYLWKSKAASQDTIVDTDEFPKPDTTLEGLAKLKPAFEKDGIVTPGNASGLNDGSAFSIVRSSSYAEKPNLTVWAKVIDYKVAGIEAEYMGMGPVPAIKDLLERNGLDLRQDVGILEINEAFAAQKVACLDEFKNHPEYKYGIGSACISGGMGIAILLENGYHKA